MKEIYKEIQEINKIDPASWQERYGKVVEEYGELVQAINMTLGRKKTDLDEEGIRSLILEECADTVQCVLSMADTCNIEINLDAHHYFIESMSVTHIMDKVFELHHEITAIYQKRYSAEFQNCIHRVAEIAMYCNFTFPHILDKIKEKNMKWRSVVISRMKNQNHREAAEKYLQTIGDLGEEQKKMMGGWLNVSEELANRIVEMTS